MGVCHGIGGSWRPHPYIWLPTCGVFSAPNIRSPSVETAGARFFWVPTQSPEIFGWGSFRRLKRKTSALYLPPPRDPGVQGSLSSRPERRLKGLGHWGTETKPQQGWDGSLARSPRTPGLGESQRSPNLASHPPDAAEPIIVRSWAALGGRSRRRTRSGLAGVEGGGRAKTLDALCFPRDLYPIPPRACPKVSSPLPGGPPHQLPPQRRDDSPQARSLFGSPF